LKFQPSLNWIRAIAILAVVIYHLSSQLIPGGWAGVDVFFVLSGYLITRLLSEELASSGHIALRRFYIRRLLRLTPAFACLLLAELVFLLLSSQSKTAGIEAWAMSATYLMNWNRAFAWFPQGSLGHTWSLAMEEQFYLVWPATLLFVYRRRPLVWIASAIVVVVAWRIVLVFHGADPERTYNGFDTHADALLVGCGLAFLPIGDAPGRLAQRFVGIPIIGMAVVLMSFHHRTILTQTVGLSLAAVISAWLVVAAMQPGRFRTVLSLKPLEYTGRISYGRYLWHYPILLIGTPYVPHAVRVLLVIAAYPVAAASFHFVEKPFLRLKARFEPTDARRQAQLDAISARAAEPALTEPLAM
jgi:peptidoglycan/LPS O-acetylase OafA/YrhL